MIDEADEVRPMTTREFWYAVMEKTEASDSLPVAVAIKGVGVGRVTSYATHNSQIWIDVELDTGAEEGL